MVQVSYKTVYTVACTRENEDRSLFEKTSISSKFLNWVYRKGEHKQVLCMHGNWETITLILGLSGMD